MESPSLRGRVRASLVFSVLFIEKRSRFGRTRRCVPPLVVGVADVADIMAEEGGAGHVQVADDREEAVAVIRTRRDLRSRSDGSESSRVRQRDSSTTHSHTHGSLNREPRPRWPRPRTWPPRPRPRSCDGREREREREREVFARRASLSCFVRLNERNVSLRRVCKIRREVELLLEGHDAVQFPEERAVRRHAVDLQGTLIPRGEREREDSRRRFF